MKNKLFYIFGISTAVLSSCHDDDMTDMFLNGKEKTPLPVSVSLDTKGSVQTRAANMEFSAGDELLVYIQHVASNNEGLISSVDADMAPALVKFKVKTGVSMAPVNDPTTIKETSDLELMSMLHEGVGENLMQSGQTTLFWDDFSDSSSDDTDLRTSDHGLRPLYGYCYNGGDKVGRLTTDLNPTAGTLGWTVDTDQTSGIKTNDLLWSGTPDSYVSYNHNNPARVGLRIPYTHAMSKVTVVLVAGKGFKGEDLNEAAITLKGLNTVCTVNAASSSLGKEQITGCATSADITMFKNSVNKTDEAGNPTRAFEAIVVPNNVWENNNDRVIATITGMDGNTYNITATESIIKQFLNKQTLDPSDKVTLEPGKNYKLTITVDKQPQNIVAEITNWEDISATGVGSIQFAADVVSHNMTTENVVGSFDLWRSAAATPDHDSFDEDGDLGNGVTKATTVTYSGGKWTNSPEIYWANGSQNYFFRALAKFVQVEEQKQIISNEDISSFDVTQGTDIVWGTTSKHIGTYTDTDGTSKTIDYDEEGTAINPRTGTVPMTFKHAMSKISVKLETISGADAVTLKEAKISIANIYDKGTIDLYSGNIGSFEATKKIPVSGLLAASDTETSGDKIKEYVVIPQSLKFLTVGTTLTPREGAMSFYNVSELTDVEGTTYVTSTLEPVYYTPQEAFDYNATLPNAIATTTIKIPASTYDTEDKVAAKNASLEGAVKAGDPLVYSPEQFAALTNAEVPEDLFNLFDFGMTYTAFLHQNPTQVFSEFTQEDYEAINAILTSSSKQCKHNAISAKAYNAKLEGAVKLNDPIPAVCYDEEEVITWNMALPGAKRAGKDVLNYIVNEGSIAAKVGDPKTTETTKIVMLIMLKDGTTYTLDLASCKDADDNAIETWERGKHYTYTITLKKEQISFRALIKDWEEKTGGGSATLDWD